MAGLTECDTYAWYLVSRDAETGDELPTGEAEQMGVFTATATGTDTVAPELTISDAAFPGVSILPCIVEDTNGNQATANRVETIIAAGGAPDLPDSPPETDHT